MYGGLSEFIHLIVNEFVIQLILYQIVLNLFSEDFTG